MAHPSMRQATTRPVVSSFDNIENKTPSIPSPAVMLSAGNMGSLGGLARNVRTRKYVPA